MFLTAHEKFGEGRALPSQPKSKVNKNIHARFAHNTYATVTLTLLFIMGLFVKKIVIRFEKSKKSKIFG